MFKMDNRQGTVVYTWSLPNVEGSLWMGAGFGENDLDICMVELAVRLKLSQHC